MRELDSDEKGLLFHKGVRKIKRDGRAGQKRHETRGVVDVLWKKYANTAMCEEVRACLALASVASFVFGSQNIFRRPGKNLTSFSPPPNANQFFGEIAQTACNSQICRENAERDAKRGGEDLRARRIFCDRLPSDARAFFANANK